MVSQLTRHSTTYRAKASASGSPSLTPPIFTFILIVWSLSACGGTVSSPEVGTPSTATASAPSDAATAPTSPQTDAPAPPNSEARIATTERPADINREIVPLLHPIPAPLSDEEKLSEDPEEIRKEVGRLIADGKRSDALPLVDVLLILDPGDLEMLETRGRILLSQGHAEDGSTDLTRCCQKGRETCCR